MEVTKWLKLDTSINGLFARDERISIGFGC
jgi:hypothetical protein